MVKIGENILTKIIRFPIDSLDARQNNLSRSLLQMIVSQNCIQQ